MGMRCARCDRILPIGTSAEYIVHLERCSGKDSPGETPSQALAREERAHIKELWARGVSPPSYRSDYN